MKLAESTPTAPGSESVPAACRVCAPALSSSRLVKVATPPTAAFVTVPIKEPAPVWTDSVTLIVESAPVVTMFPFASSTLTTGCVPKVDPAVAAAGWVL